MPTTSLRNHYYIGNGKLYALTSNNTNHNTHLYVKCLKFITLRLGVGLSQLFSVGPNVINNRVYFVLASRTDRKENKPRRSKTKMHWLQCGYSPDDFIRPSTREHCPNTDPNDTDDEQLTCDETLTSRTYDYDLTAAFTKHHQRTENHPRTHSVNRANADGTHWSANTAAPLLKVHGKGTAIYEPRGTVSDVGEDSEVESLHESPFPRCFTPSPRSSSLVCRLRADGLDPAHLADLYGQHYAEGRCRPRRFTVNVAWLHATRTSQGGAAKGREVVLVFCIGRKVNRRSWVTDENSSVVLQDAVVSQYVR